MIQQGSALFDNLIVAVGTNPDKAGMLSVSDRMAILADEVHTLGVVNVTVGSFENKFLVEYAHETHAKYILRGIRNKEDYVNEHLSCNWNADLRADIKTVCLFPPRDVVEVSSSLVKRALIGPEDWQRVITRFVSPLAAEKLAAARVAARAKL